MLNEHSSVSLDSFLWMVLPARHPENISVPGALIVPLDGPIYYANALTVRDQIKTMIEEAKTGRENCSLIWAPKMNLI